MADDPYARIAELEAENAALRGEMKRTTAERDTAREQQTATADILHIIADAPTDLVPVLDAVVERGLRLSASSFAALMLRDGDVGRVVAFTGRIPADSRYGNTLYDVPLTRRTTSTRVILTGLTIHIPDRSDSSVLAEYPDSAFAGATASLTVPLTRERHPIGALTLVRHEPKPYSQHEIQLAQTFADQAVIAIENARLFEELNTSNAQLRESNRLVTEALEQQTATADVLRIIATSPTDAQPVLDAIADSALRLTRSTGGTVSLREGDLLRVTAGAGHGLRYPPGTLLNLVDVQPGHVAVLEGRTIHIPDRSAPEFRARFPLSNHSPTATLTVPLIAQTGCIGNVGVGRDAALALLHGCPAARRRQETTLSERGRVTAVIAGSRRARAQRRTQRASTSARSSRLTGFARKSSIPAFAQRSRSAAVVRAVNAMIARRRRVPLAAGSASHARIARAAS
jgi:GAF domain-containing protein